MVKLQFFNVEGHTSSSQRGAFPGHHAERFIGGVSDPYGLDNKRTRGTSDRHAFACCGWPVRCCVIAHGRCDLHITPPRLEKTTQFDQRGSAPHAGSTCCVGTGLGSTPRGFHPSTCMGLVWINVFFVFPLFVFRFSHVIWNGCVRSGPKSWFSEFSFPRHPDQVGNLTPNWKCFENLCKNNLVLNVAQNLRPP